MNRDGEGHRMNGDGDVVEKKRKSKREGQEKKREGIEKEEEYNREVEEKRMGRKRITCCWSCCKLDVSERFHDRGKLSIT